MHFTTSLLSLWLSACLTSATPVRQPITEDDIKLLQSRDKWEWDYKNLVNTFPSCDHDPGQSKDTSRWKELEENNKQEGLQIVTTCRNKAGHRKDACWTDFFLVDWQYEYSEWENEGVKIDCATTKDCNRQLQSSNQTCETNTESWDNKLQGTIEAKLGDIWKTLSPWTLKFEYAHNFGGSKSRSACTTSSDSARCTWDDKKCHGFWTAKQGRRVFGFARRICEGPRSEDHNMRFERSDGKWTIGMLDFNFLMPDSVIVGCAAKCDDSEYPDDNVKPGPRILLEEPV